MKNRKTLSSFIKNKKENLLANNIRFGIKLFCLLVLALPFVFATFKLSCYSYAKADKERDRPRDVIITPEIIEINGIIDAKIAELQAEENEYIKKSPVAYLVFHGFHEHKYVFCLFIALYIILTYFVCLDYYIIKSSIKQEYKDKAQLVFYQNACN